MMSSLPTLPFDSREAYPFPKQTQPGGGDDVIAPVRRPGHRVGLLRFTNPPEPRREGQSV